MEKEEIDHETEELNQAEAKSEHSSDSTEESAEESSSPLTAEERIVELEQEMERLKDAQLRKAADLENMRKRLNRERDLIYQSSREAAVEAFLPVGDDLGRTIKAMESDPKAEPYLDGVKMVAEKFDSVLNRYGVERIDQSGVPFDINLHDAMLIQKAPDESTESGIVLQVVENGYRIGDKTVRHAKVIVSE